MAHYISLPTRLMPVLLAGALLTACAAAAPTGRPPGEAPAAVNPGPKKITVALNGNPPGLNSRLNPAGTSTPGLAEVVTLIAPSLSAVNSEGARIPHLAAGIPALADGSWRVLPDGSMQTTWKLRPNTTWHDGQPFTTADLVFAATIARDRELSEFSHRAMNLVDRIENADPLTVTVHWKEPYIEADSMFTSFAEALPRHILEPVYQDSKARVRESAYFNAEFVGNGPYQVKELIPGASVLLEAYPSYILGRPRIDTVEVKFIPDTQTLMANVLAGEIDVTFGRWASVEQGTTMRDRWDGGKVSFGIGNTWIPIYPQLLDPTPAVVVNPQFRRALLHAMDREAMANTVQAGLVPVAHSIISPNHPEYRAVEPRMAKYAYDPRRAVQMIEALGLTRGSDGLFREASGEKLSLEIRFVTAVDTTRLLSLATAEYWRQAGLETNPLVIPPQLNQDRHYRATFPSFELVNQGSGVGSVPGLLHGANASLPSNDYRPPQGTNRSRYRNPEYDAMLDAFTRTVDPTARLSVLTDIIHHQTDQALLLGTVYAVQPQPIANRLKNATLSNALGTLIVWDVQLWDVS